MWLKQQQVDQQEEELREKIRAFPDQKRAEIFRQLRTELKDPDTYAALNWTLVAGLHHFYLSKWGRALVELAAFVFGIFLLFNDIKVGLVFIVITLLVELVELMRSQITVQHHNNQLTKEIINRNRLS